MAPKGTDELTRTCVDQALYGYRRGHELLASSTELRAESRAALLVFTDMSGPSLVPGFESYLTGVPLAADAVYAFSRTWYAAEMPRPGCVWTHVLLIKRDDLVRLPDLRGLCSLFRRPHGDTLEPYEMPVSLDGHAQSAGAHVDVDKAASLLEAFYTSSLPLVIPSNKPAENEDMVLALWSQLGPNARFAFSFCTGSMSIRKFKGASLSLQIVPPEVRRQVDRAPSEAVVVEFDKPKSADGWIRSLAREMAANSPDRIGTIIRSLDLQGEDREILPVVAPVVLTSDRKDEMEAIQLLIKASATAWPNHQDGKAAKRRLFGNTGTLSKLLQIDLSEPELLRALSVCSAPGAFDASSLRLRERASALWGAEGDAARTLVRDLLNGDGNELGDDVLSGLMETAPDAELWGLVEKNSSLVLALLRRDAALAESPRLWQLPRLRATDVLDAIEQAAPNRLSAVVVAALEAGRFDVGRLLLERRGSPVARTILEWFARAGGIDKEPPRELIKALGRHHEIAVNMLHQRTLHPEATVIALSTLSVEQLEDLSVEFLLEVISTGFGRLAKTFGPDIHAMILARGLKVPNGGDRLVAATFTTVHRALAESSVGYEAWRPLDRLLPSLLWRDWDKCERLRRGLVEAIEKNRWPLNLLFNATKEEDVFRLMLKTCRSNSAGRAFLRRAQKDAANSIGNFQKRMLQDEDGLD